MWTSVDYDLHEDGTVIERDVDTYGDSIIDAWRRDFQPHMDQVWVILHDSPDLIVMMTRHHVEGRGYRFSITTRDT